MLQCSVALAACAPLNGAPGGVDLPEDPPPAAGDWPRLVDAPQAMTPGRFSAAAPDPANGAAVRRALAIDAAAAHVEAERLAAPVIPAPQARRLRGAARR